MAPTERPFSDRLIQDLSENGLEYGFFHVLRLMRQIFPDDPPIGSAIRPSQESFRLNQATTLAFAPTSIKNADYDEEKERLHLWTYVLGLTGPNGPMPVPLSEFLLNRKHHHKDTVLESFFNVFNHRILSLFYRSWALNNPAVDFENRDKSRLYRHSRSLIGIGSDATRKRDHIDDHAKVFQSGMLSSSIRTKEGLESILSSYFEMPARIEPFQGQWMTLPEEAKCQMGASESTGLLGQNLIVGSMIWECQIRFRIVFGPLEMDDFQRLLPGRPGYQHLAEWIKLYAGFGYEWEVQLILRKEEVAPIQLGKESFLGWTTWMVSKEISENRGDLVLSGVL